MGTSGSQGKASIPRSTDREWSTDQTTHSAPEKTTSPFLVVFYFCTITEANVSTLTKSAKHDLSTLLLSPDVSCSLFLRLNTELMTTTLCLQWHKQSLLNSAVLLPVQAKQGIFLLPLVGKTAPPVGEYCYCKSFQAGTALHIRQQAFQQCNPGLFQFILNSAPWALNSWEPHIISYEAEWICPEHTAQGLVDIYKLKKRQQLTWTHSPRFYSLSCQERKESRCVMYGKRDNCY